MTAPAPKVSGTFFVMMAFVFPVCVGIFFFFFLMSVAQRNLDNFEVRTPASWSAPPFTADWKSIRQGMPEYLIPGVIGSPEEQDGNYWRYPDGGRVFLDHGKVFMFIKPQDHSK